MKTQINFTILQKPEFFTRKPQMRALLKRKTVSTPGLNQGRGYSMRAPQRERALQKVTMRRTQTFTNYLHTRRFQ